MTSYFLYARKSTDREDRQVYSIADQMAVMRELAKLLLGKLAISLLYRRTPVWLFFHGGEIYPELAQ